MYCALAEEILMRQPWGEAVEVILRAKLIGEAVVLQRTCTGLIKTMKGFFRQKIDGIKSVNSKQKRAQVDLSWIYFCNYSPKFRENSIFTKFAFQNKNIS